MPARFGVADGHVADVVLVGQERDGDRGDAGEPGGQQPQVGQRDLAAERAQPGVQVGDLVVGQPLGEFADEPLGRDAEQFVGAFLAGPGADDLVGVGVVLQHRDQFGDPLVGVGHVGVGPDHDLAPGVLGADPADRARAAVAAERHDLQVRERRRGVLQPGQRAVGGRVVVGGQLVVIPAGVHRRADPRHLGDNMPLLVMTRQDDRHIRILPRRTRNQIRPRSSGRHRGCCRPVAGWCGWSWLLCG